MPKTTYALALPTHAPALRLSSRTLYAEPATMPRADHTLAAVLWALAVPAVRPSDVRHVYESIECAPNVGRNLSARV